MPEQENVLLRIEPGESYRFFCSIPLPSISALETRLQDILSESASFRDPLYAVDGIVPSIWIAQPKSIDELSAILGTCNEHGAAVIPWGAGRHIALGNIPARYDIALRTTKLDRVLEYEPADLTITVEAGITMGRLQSVLAEHGQFLPIDAPAHATAGGVLSAGLSGPSAHAYGLPRDWLIGCRMALADGTLIKCGGRVVKNVAGYDIQKLAVGSLGTLGVIVEATFKVAPSASGGETLVVRCASIEEAAQLAAAADARSLALRAVALRQAQDDVTTAFWLSGPSAAVERTRRELGEACGAAPTERLEGEASMRWWGQLSEFDLAADATSLRVSLLPSDVFGFLATLSDHTVDAVAYPTTGLLLARRAPGGVEDAISFISETRRQAAERGGSLIVTSAPVEVKEQIDVWGLPGDALPLMRRLKEQFDPRGTLSPGRYVV